MKKGYADMPCDDIYNKEQTEKMSKEDKKAFGDYNAMCRAEDDLHTLMRANEVKEDKERYNKAINYAKMEADKFKKMAKMSGE